MQNFRELRVWKAAHALRLDVYRTTRSFPREEIYGLTSQVRRSSGSIATNIAESCGLRGERDTLRFLFHAMASSSETFDHFITARDLGYVTSETYEGLESDLVSVRKMLSRLIRKIEDRNP